MKDDEIEEILGKQGECLGRIVEILQNQTTVNDEQQSLNGFFTIVLALQFVAIILLVFIK